MTWIIGWLVAAVVFMFLWKRGMDVINPLNEDDYKEFNTWPNKD